ncbi:P-loop containing nucleoside triphosphate hydrolase protein, partial [Mycena leptocephala]
RASSNSLSMLPSEPKIFHGRESELGEIVAGLALQPARIAILGAGGMGKTSLARAALHHPDVVHKYEHRVFVAADSVTNERELATLIAVHLGLRPAKYIVQQVVQHFSKGSPCLLVVDNLETVWEPLDSRGDVKEFLSLLTDIKHLALIITMRGAERPGKVCWTRPFLLPLQPLSDDAARKTFVDITDNSHNSNDIARLLSLTDNMPLAVDLIANLAYCEGCNDILARWEMEKTSVLSSGGGRQSNLDESISLSLSSPRITALSGAKELLSLLSILPDGLSDSDLLQSKLPIKDILACKAVLLRTALAYTNHTKARLKVLVPIREYMQHHYPAS